MILVLVIECNTNTFYTQDIHFSLFDMSPLNLNPANTGNFNGDYRFTGNHRNQWSSVTIPYSTFAASVEMKNALKRNMLSTAIQINQDRAGDSRFNTFQANWSGAYHQKLDKDSLKNITYAIQSGITNRNLAYQDLRFDAQYDGFQYNSTLNNQETFVRNSHTYINFNTGILYSQYVSSSLKFNAGIGLANITQPKQSMFNDDAIRLDMRWSTHANAHINLNTKYTLIPSFLWAQQGAYKSINIGANLHYTIVDFAGVYRGFWGGMFYRNRDAIYLTIGVDYDQWKVGVSYDVNISTLKPASNLRGSFEIAVQYIINKKSFQRVFHRVCPDYL